MNVVRPSLLECTALNMALFHISDDAIERGVPVDPRRKLQIDKAAKQLFIHTVDEANNPAAIELLKPYAADAYRDFYYHKETKGESEATRWLMTKSSNCWRNFASELKP